MSPTRRGKNYDLMCGTGDLRKRSTCLCAAGPTDGLGLNARSTSRLCCADGAVSHSHVSGGAGIASKWPVSPMRRSERGVVLLFNDFGRHSDIEHE